MGDSLPDINVDQLTDSVNNAVNAGLLPPLPLLPPPPPTSLLPPPPPPPAPMSFPGPVAGLPPLPVYNSLPPFPVPIAVPASDTGSDINAGSVTSQTSAADTGNRECTTTTNTTATTTTSTSTTTPTTASDGGSNEQPPPPQQATLPVSLPGYPPMFITFSLQPLPLSDSGSGGSQEQTPSSSTSASTMGPRLPPFPPPFPLLFPMLPPLQDGRPLRPPLPCPHSSCASSTPNSLPPPPASFPQGMPLPPLLLQLPSSLPLPPLLPPSPMSAPQSGLPLPPLLPQPPSSGVMGGLSLPPLLPHPPGSQSGLPPLLPHPPNSEAQSSLPLPPFPPQSFAAFVQSGLPMTSLSPSNLPLPHLLPPVPPLSDGSIPMLPIPPGMTIAVPQSDGQMTLTYSIAPATSSPADNPPMSSYIPVAFPPLHTLQPEKETSDTAGVAGSSGPPHILPPPPPLPAQLFPPLPFIPGAPPPPGFFSQMPTESVRTEVGKTHLTPAPESRENRGQEERVQQQAVPAPRPADVCDKCHRRQEEESIPSCGPGVPSETDEDSSDTLIAQSNKGSPSESRGQEGQLPGQQVRNDVCNGCSLSASEADKRGEGQDVCNSNSIEVHSAYTVLSDASLVTSQRSSVACSVSSQDAGYLHLPNTASHAETACSSRVSFHSQFSGNCQPLLAHHVIHPAPADKGSGLHPPENGVLDHVPTFLQGFGKNDSGSHLMESTSDMPHHPGLSGESENDGLSQQLFSTPFQTTSASTLECSQTQYTPAAGGGSHGISSADHTVMRYSDSGENSVLTQLAGPGDGRTHDLPQLQVMHGAGVSVDPFSLPSLPVDEQNHRQDLLPQDLPNLPDLQEGHCSNMAGLTEQLSSSCEVERHALQGDKRHHQPSPSDPGQFSSLPDEHHPVLAELHPTLTTLTHSSAHSDHLNTSAASAMDIDCSALGSGDPAYQFQSSLATEFNFTAPCTPQVSMGQDQQALLPGVGYSPPGLSNQGLSPNLFGQAELESSDHGVMVDKHGQNLESINAQSAGGLGLTSMSVSVLDMLLKEDLALDKTASGTQRSPDKAGAGDGGLCALEHPQPLCAFTGQFCVECNKMYQAACHHHNTQYHHIADTPILTKARASLPACLRLGQSNVTGHFNNTGVFAKEKVAAKTEFGPLQGKMEQPSDKVETSSFTRWKIFYEGSVRVINISDENESNWLMFLKPAKNAVERNVMAFQRDHNISYVTCKDIEPETELLFWFSSEYCKMLGPTGKRLTAASEHCPYCPVCSRVFFDRRQLRQHTTQQHKDAVKRKWYCTVCSAGFCSTAKLNAHVCTRHMNLKPHTCQICGKGFSCTSNLKKHKMVHTGVKKFQCDVCGQHFMQKAHLQSHQITHTGSKTAQCGYCGKRFNRATDMRQHELQHTKEQTWNCELCSKTFHRSVLLRRHMKVHNNERNYMCEWCSKTFYTKYHLTRHGWSCKWAKGAVRAPSSSSVSLSVSSSVSSLSAAGQNGVKVVGTPNCAVSSSVVTLQGLKGQGQVYSVNPVVIGVSQAGPRRDMKSSRQGGSKQ